ncbi:hypothetical protein BDK51DRAFT_47799 [Blyttiomyces helicus]|uniref:Uncharacterized protein n=1 Tax=Blyttiomyces helicus TaxID=388810 RepID=A0A4P9W4L5_9FUNG|nr:hypothetical protein BDK51DRAFT_47799 [Blyttiomyces helicus]|eukprot:RKO85640.1 hypothetical protein BDK51DRAFT_47799 [Blyttiomyces helicus]
MDLVKGFHVDASHAPRELKVGLFRVAVFASARSRQPSEHRIFSFSAALQVYDERSKWCGAALTNFQPAPLLMHKSSSKEKRRLAFAVRPSHFNPLFSLLTANQIGGWEGDHIQEREAETEWVVKMEKTKGTISNCQTSEAAESGRERGAVVEWVSSQMATLESITPSRWEELGHLLYLHDEYERFLKENFTISSEGPVVLTLEIVAAAPTTFAHFVYEICIGAYLTTPLADPVHIKQW